MIIHSPNVRSSADRVRVAARIELEARRRSLPDELWFDFPLDHEGFISERADGFLAALVVPAMQWGEDIELRGVVSPRLLHGLRELQRSYHTRFPQRFQMVDIKVEAYADPEKMSAGDGVACAFSGGIDSFYTLRKHLPESEAIPGYALTHALFLHGFEIPLEDEYSFGVAARSYAPMLAALGVKLLTGRTNLRLFELPWDLAYGAVLASTALVLGGLLKRFYIAAARTPEYFARFFGESSQSYLIDPLFSTETLDILQDGGTLRRVEKVLIAQWPKTFGQLRVCWEKPNGLLNCCRCAKCIRTMINLELLGVLEKHSTFPLPLTGAAIRKTRFRIWDESYMVDEILPLARAAGRGDLAFNLRWALLRSRWLLGWQAGRLRVRNLVKGLYRRIVPLRAGPAGGKPE